MCIGRQTRSYTAKIIRVAISPKEDTVASVGEDGRFYVWALNEPNKPILRYQSPRLNDSLFALAYAPQGGKVVIGGKDRIARIYDLVNPNLPPVPLEHPDSVLSASFSSDERYLLIGFAGGAQLWDLSSDKKYPLQHLTGAFAVGFSPDGNTMVTAGTDRQARLWDVATRKQIGPPLLHPGPVFAATLTNKELITATFPPGTMVHRWPLARGGEKSLEELRRKAMSISNIKFGLHNTPQALDGKDWSALQSNPINDEWRKTWQDWPKAPSPPKYVPKKTMNEPKAKSEPTKEPDAKNPEIKWDQLKVPANLENLNPERFYPKVVNLILQAKLARIHTSAWAVAHKETLDLLHAQVKEFIPAEISTLVNLTKDVERISAATDDDLETGVLVLEGQFKSLYASAKAAGVVDADSVPVSRVVGGYHFALVSDKILVAARDRESLKSALIRAADANRATLPLELVALFKKAGATADMHFMATSAWLQKKPGAFMLPVPAILGTVKLEDKTARLKVLGKADNEEAAAELAKNAESIPLALNGLADKYRILQPLAEARSTFKANSEQRFVFLRMDLPNAGFDKLVKGLLAP